ncbi:MAG: NAD(+)/NADH kinase [Treponemataceae bacterium]|nr:NAD(+)/NADH kinase [Treponemataceae bacterium]
MKKCLVIINSYNEEALKLASNVEDFLKNKEISCKKILFSGQNSIDFDYNNNDQFKNVLCAITLGGDGTVLFAARFCALHEIPIFPINLGQFGFIAGIQVDKWQSSFQMFLERKLPVAERTMIMAELYRDGKKVFTSNALNDVSITGQGAARIVSLSVNCNGNDLGNFKSDGIVLATATGSTAYAAAAGGPIVDPGVDALVMCPICAFTLSNRPLVLPPWSEVRIKVLPSRGADVCVTCDGQVTFDAEVGDEIVISRADERITLIACDSSVFYGALRSKLNWSGGSLA